MSNRASNQEILMMETMMAEFDWDGENLFTYAEWKSRGYQVKRGEKAIISTSLWRPFTKENDKGEKEIVFRLVKSHLFSNEQVEKIKN